MQEMLYPHIGAVGVWLRPPGFKVVNVHDRALAAARLRWTASVLTRYLTCPLCLQQGHELIPDGQRGDLLVVCA